MYRKNYRKPSSAIVPTHAVWSHGYRRPVWGRTMNTGQAQKCQARNLDVKPVLGNSFPFHSSTGKTTHTEG